MGRAIGDVLRCSHPLSPEYCRTRSRIAVALRIVSGLSVRGAKSRWVAAGGGCRQCARSTGVVRRLFWRDRPSPLTMSMSDHICASICRTARSNARLSRTFSSSPSVTLNKRSEGPVGDHSDRARDQIPHMAQSMYQ